jgi:protein-disulfide isomerase
VAIAVSFAVRSLQLQNELILQELARIRQALENVPGYDRVKLTNVSGDFLGSADAPLTMVEFTDLQCPFCREYHMTVFQQIKHEYIDSGKLRYFTRDFPLESLHPLAIDAVRATYCARAQGKFWEMRHTILANNIDLKPGSFRDFAQTLRFDTAHFQACMDTTAAIDRQWQRDRGEGIAMGISGTPSFVIGRSGADGVDGIRLSGAKPYNVFKIKFEELLADESDRR